MSPELWKRVKEVAGAAFELDGERRSRFLDQECGSDLELRSAVEALLQADQNTGQTVEEAIGAAAAHFVGAPAPEGRGLRPGYTISHYTITQKLGEGGMGVV